MSVNRDKPHVWVLPEDDANKDLANGFHLELQHIRQMQVFPPTGGWSKVLDTFQSVHLGDMQTNLNRFMVLLIDFDGRRDRLERAKAVVPPGIADRVFILGAWTEPEKLKSAGLGSYEAIGKAMAKDCREGTRTIWAHELLRHNTSEIDRLHSRVWPFLVQA
jgi:hypothetical protein